VRLRQAPQERRPGGSPGGRQGPGRLPTFSLSDVLVSGYQTAGTNAEAPLDSISLNFSKIELAYKEQAANGSLGPTIRVGWDRKTNKQF
jgi:type VI protein secretion system component Hcp